MYDDCDEENDVTMAMCIRCAQLFVARGQCPYCSDLVLRIRASVDEPGTWECEVSLKIAENADVLALLGGYSSPMDAQARGHAFIRQVVQQLKRTAAQH